MKEINTNCTDVMNHICENLGEDFDSPTCVAIKNHLKNCNNCQKYLKSIGLTIELYKNYNAEISDDMHNRLLDVLGISDCK